MRTPLWTALVIAASAGCSTTPATTAPAASDSSPAGPESIAAPLFTISTAAADVEHGNAIFTKKGCFACHKIGGGKLVGPDLKGVTARRNPLWIERIILHPEIMMQQDATTRELVRQHAAPMVNQQVNPDSELPALLAYLKANER